MTASDYDQLYEISKRLFSMAHIIWDVSTDLSLLADEMKVNEVKMEEELKKFK